MVIVQNHSKTIREVKLQELESTIKIESTDGRYATVNFLYDGSTIIEGDDSCVLKHN